MTRLMTVKRAKDEIKRLQEYVDLVETYQAETLEKMIIKEYAYTSSIVGVIKELNGKGFTHNGEPIDRDYVVSVINSSKTTGELHRLLRLGYRAKIKPNKMRYL